MSLKSVSNSSNQIASIPSRQNIPVLLTDLSAFMKERFHQEMDQIDQQMHKFSSDLTQCNGESAQVMTGHESSIPQKAMWDLIRDSPLVIGEGKDKTLQLQFDVSQFDPSEIKVKVMNDMLIVTANHEEATQDTSTYQKYTRQFRLPPGTDPEQIISTLYRDGVLMVQVPLIQSVTNSIMDPEE